MAHDFSMHRMTNWAWIQEYEKRLGKEIFQQFLDMTYSWLSTLRPGESIDLTAHPKITARNRDLFIKVGCMYISEGNSNYEFSNDFTKISNNGIVSRFSQSTKREALAKKRKRVSV